MTGVAAFDVIIGGPRRFAASPFDALLELV
jgi:hypothetical protein